MKLKPQTEEKIKYNYQKKNIKDLLKEDLIAYQVL